MALQSYAMHCRQCSVVMSVSRFWTMMQRIETVSMHLQDLGEKYESELGEVRAEVQAALLAVEAERAAVVDAHAAATAATGREGAERDAREAAEERVAALDAELDAMRQEVRTPTCLFLVSLPHAAMQQDSTNGCWSAGGAAQGAERGSQVGRGVLACGGVDGGRCRRRCRCGGD